MTNRTEPDGKPACSIAGTIEGLNSAADSIAYSIVKQAPMSRRRRSLSSPAPETQCLTDS